VTSAQADSSTLGSMNNVTCCSAVGVHGESSASVLRAAVLERSRVEQHWLGRGAASEETTSGRTMLT
jgi:hypothetical protein